MTLRPLREAAVLNAFESLVPIASGNRCLDLLSSWVNLPGPISTSLSTMKVFSNSRRLSGPGPTVMHPSSLDLWVISPLPSALITWQRLTKPSCT
jgi:hypothetical protein